MAHLVSQDVVKQDLSTGAQTPVDVSESQLLASGALAAANHVQNNDTERSRGNLGAQETGRSTQSPAFDHKSVSNNHLSVDHPVESSITSDNDPDTDTSRVDAADTASKGSGDPDAAPKYGVKKFSAFKPISVTKSFLAKTAAVPASTAKTSLDKGLASPTPTNTLASTARPRLVAKLGASGGLSSPKPGSMSSLGKGNGPDPLQVWNKNRVQTPQATPKALTDEELRQQYGIQLASRPQEDGDGKEAKWADIDSDDDDWGPETIEWTDGTKTDLAEIERAAKLAKEAEEKAAKEREAAAKAKLLSSRPSAGANPTVLKVGGLASNKPSLINTSSKSTVEKAVLTAKPPASASAKSPWAPLPAIDKTTPIMINPPPEAQNPLFQDRPEVQHGERAVSSHPFHAQEIAADDFSRLSRDDLGASPKELFNSQSGRYEPVTDRRASMRRDSTARQPALLQRASNENGPQHFQARRRSSAAQYADRFASGHGGYADSQRTPAMDNRSSAINTKSGVHVIKAQPSPSTPAQPEKDFATIQLQIMREKRDAAIKRKQDEEAAEEAAKKERIRRKMEELDMNAKHTAEKSAVGGGSSSVGIVAPETSAVTSAIPTLPVNSAVDVSGASLSEATTTQTPISPAPASQPSFSSSRTTFNNHARSRQEQAFKHRLEPAGQSSLVSAHASSVAGQQSHPFSTQHQSFAADRDFSTQTLETRNQSNRDPFGDIALHEYSHHPFGPQGPEYSEEMVGSSAVKTGGPPAKGNYSGLDRLTAAFNRLHTKNYGPDAQTTLSQWKGSSREYFQAQDKLLDQRNHEASLAREAEAKAAGDADNHSLPALTTKYVRFGYENGKRVDLGTTIEHHNLRSAADNTLPLVTGDLDQFALLPETAPQTQVRSRYQDMFDSHQHAHAGAKLATIEELKAARLAMSKKSLFPPAPPPPEMSDHPAHQSGAQAPRVRLPGAPSDNAHEGVKPRVKFPSQQNAAVVSTPSTVKSQNEVIRSRPGSNNTPWQDRFDGLFHKTPVSRNNYNFVAHVPSTVSSTSKAPFMLDEQKPVASPISLPVQKREIESPSVEQADALFETRVFGSVPTIKIPTGTHIAREAVANMQMIIPNAQWQKFALQTHHVQSCPVLLPSDLEGGATLINIKLLGMLKAQTFSLRRGGQGQLQSPTSPRAYPYGKPRPPGSYRGGSSHRGGRGYGGRGRGGKHAAGDRKTSASQANPAQSPAA